MWGSFVESASDFWTPSTRQLARRRSYWRSCLVAVLSLSGSSLAYDPQNPCAHEASPDVGAINQLNNKQSVYVETIQQNKTHRYQFEMMQPSIMVLPDNERKLIINLEPCKGVVYLFVRKTRRCFPNPYSCILPPSSGNVDQLAHPSDCEWTHYMSVIDGTRDGAPTFFELPLTSTRWFISVYAKETSSYTLTILANVGEWPRPGREGRVTASPLQELQVQIGWYTATYRPIGMQTLRYWIYAAMLLSTDERTNAAVFLTKKKIMNTVCGLQNNTDRPATTTPIPASRCQNERCNATIDGVVTGKRYVFNVIAESNAGFNMSYAGLILQTDYTVERRAASEQTLHVVAVITGAILGMVIIIYCWMINLYGK